MTDLVTNLFVLDGIIAAILATSLLTAPAPNKPTEIVQLVVDRSYQKNLNEAAYEALVAKLAVATLQTVITPKE